MREAIRYSLLAPGKRLRPMLVLMAAEACGGSLSAAMPAACAVEMIHAYSLIHDDLPAMDDDDLRRGRPTCHKVFGEAMAILAGDGLLSLAFQVLAEGVRPPAVAAACCAALAEASGPCQLVGGQADDIAADRAAVDGAHLDREHLESIHARKTGAMIRVSLRLGGMTAGPRPSHCRPWTNTAEDSDWPFKSPTTSWTSAARKKTWASGCGKTPKRARSPFPGCSGVDESAAYAAQLIAEACAALEPLGPRAEGLITLARYVLERNR